MKEQKSKDKKETLTNAPTQDVLNWSQIIMLLGSPLWDSTKRMWRILNGYQSVLGNESNIVFLKVTFTDTPYWENFADKRLYIDVPKENEEQKNVSKMK